MHNISFKKLVFSNFMSYGDIPNTVDFVDGLTYLNAANGYGKSAIIEALTFALFGNSYRGGTIADLKNTENVHSEMKTSLDFSVDNGKEVHEYRVERNLKPKAKSPTFKLFIDGVEQSKKAGLGQSSFENEILGFDFKLFKYVIALNSQETTPFVEMPVPKKRELLEQVISVSTEKWKKLNNKTLSDASMNFDTSSKSVERIVKDIEYMNNMIASLKDKKKIEVDALVAKRDAKLATRPDILRGCETSLAALNLATEEYNAAKAKVDEINSASYELTKVYSEIEAQQKCVKLIDDIASEEKNIAELEEKLYSAKNDSKKYQNEILEEKIQAITSEINTQNMDISALKVTISSNNNEIDRIEKLKSKLKNDADTQTKLSEEQKVGVPCPTCGKPSTEEDVAKVKASIDAVINDLRHQWIEHNNMVKELKRNNQTCETKIATATELIRTKTSECSLLTEKLNEYNDYVKNNIAPIDFAIADSKSRIANMRSVISQHDCSLDALNKLTARRDELIAKTSISSDVNAIFNEKSDAFRNATSNHNSFRQQIQYLDNEISELDKEIENAKREENDESLQISINRMTELQCELVNAQNEVSMYSEKIELCKYITYLCSDEGLKSYIIKLFVPYFNNAVEDNLKRFNLPFHFVFDSTMDYKYSSSIGSAPVYDMLSDGQKRKVGFAIAMAFCDFVFTIANFRINCMFLDEILDISTDDYALRDMVGLVRARTQKTPVIFAVTHRAKIIQDLFDYKLNINNNGMFSSIGSREDVSSNIN